MPIMKRFCEWASGSEDSEAVLSVARLHGRICYELKGKGGLCFHTICVFACSNRLAVQSIASPVFIVNQS